MKVDRDIALAAYEVRTGQRQFKDVPEADRKAVATAMRHMGTADYQELCDSLRTPRGGGYGERHTSRVS